MLTGTLWAHGHTCTGMRDDAYHITARMPIPTHRCMAPGAWYTEVLASAPGLFLAGTAPVMVDVPRRD